MKNYLLCFMLPLIPLLSRGGLCLRFRKKMLIHLEEKELDREAHRGQIIAFAGFSFTGLLALVVIDSTLQQGFRLAIFYLLVSFLAYLWALNLQSYKSSRLSDQFATALSDIGSLGLILSVVAVLITGDFGLAFTSFLAVLSIVVWGIDHVLKVRFQYHHLKELEGSNA